MARIQIGTGLGDIVRTAGDLIGQVLPDHKAAQEFQYKMAELADRADEREVELMKAQTEVNKEEAKHANLFVAGWRPFVGWCCGLAFVYTAIVAPAFGLGALPMMDINSLLFGLLGLGAMRTYEKTRGVATSVGGKVLTPTAPKADGGGEPAWVKDDPPY